MNDLRSAFRQLLKSPGFTAIAVLTLGLGIGACTAIFSVVNSVLLKPLAYPQSERIVRVNETKLPVFPQFSVAPGNYFEWRQQATSFEELAAVRGARYNLTGTGEPLRVEAERITPNYLTTLRTQPLIGRAFTDEDADTSRRVALLSHGFWLRHFGERADILDQSIQLDGQTYPIVGVMSENFDRGGRAEIFTPVSYTEDNQNRGGHYVRVFGRLKSGVTLEQARTEMVLIAERLAQQYPDTNHGWSVMLTPLLESRVGDVRPLLYSLLGAVGFLLLIACANVASLFLARATSRAKEMAVRTALGASRHRIIRQLLVESVLFAFLGGVLGVLLAQWGVSALLAFGPADLPRAAEIALDGRALAFTCVLSLLTGVAFGLVPAFQASRVDLNSVLKDGGRGTSEGVHRQRLRGALVVAEVAIALLLLIGAGLLLRSFSRLQDVDPGFNPRGAFAASLNLPPQKYGTPAQRTAFVEGTLAQLTAIPGVTSAGVSHILPFSGDDYNLAFTIPGRAPLAPGATQTALFYAISPGYHKAMGIQLLRGRYFATSDADSAPRVSIINESMAKKYFPDQDPLGQRIRITNAESEIIGIVADTKHYDLGRESQVQVYEPYAQVPFEFLTFVVRYATPIAGETASRFPADAIPAAIRTAIYAVDRDQPIASVSPLSALLTESVARQRFTMFLFLVFSGVALLLAAIGIYGVMAYAVTQRTGEIGIRMALGAQRAHVIRLIFGHGSRLIALGLVAGLAGAIALTRFLSSMLFGVSAHDPLTFVAIALLLAGVAGFACLIPALRATKVDPMTALRAE